MCLDAIPTSSHADGRINSTAHVRRVHQVNRIFRNKDRNKCGAGVAVT